MSPHRRSVAPSYFSSTFPLLQRNLSGSCTASAGRHLDNLENEMSLRDPGSAIRGVSGIRNTADFQRAELRSRGAAPPAQARIGCLHSDRAVPANRNRPIRGPMGATDEAQTPRDFECRRDRFRDLERLLRSRTGGCSGMRRLLEHLETAAPISLWVYSRIERKVVYTSDGRVSLRGQGMLSTRL